MRSVLFTSKGPNAPAYSCNKPGDMSGHYYHKSDVNVILNPRLWTKSMHDAWHHNLPDIQKAFDELRKCLDT